MKKIIIILLLFWKISCAFGQDDSIQLSLHQPTTVYLRIHSQELSVVNGAISIQLMFKIIGTIHLDSVKFTSSIRQSNPFFSYQPVQQHEDSLFGHNYFDTLFTSFNFTYDSSNLPFYPQTITINGSYTDSADSIPKRIYAVAKVYFTPYGTVEIWDEADFYNLKRVWLVSPNNTEAERQFVHQDSIPLSNIPDDSTALQHKWQDDCNYAFIKGLAYAIPMQRHYQATYINELDSNYGSLHKDGCGLGFDRYTYTISGRVTSQIINDLGITRDVGLGNLQVKLFENEWPDNYYTAVDDEFIGEFETDSQGNYQYEFSICQSFLEGGDIEPYLVVKAFAPYSEIEAISTNGNVNINTGNIPLFTRRAIVGPLTLNENGYANDPVTLNGNVQDLSLLSVVYADRAMKFARRNLNITIDGGIRISPYLTVLAENYFFPSTFLTPPSISLTQVGTGNENVIYHEFGHFLMWILQDKSWINPLTASFVDYELNGNSNPNIAWTEGWAEGFMSMCDMANFWMDEEFHRDSRLGFHYEERTNLPDVTDGVLSIRYIGASIFDLFDGDDKFTNYSIPGPGGTSPWTHDDWNSGWGIERDNISLSLQQICQPLIDHAGLTGKLHTIGEYFGALLQDLQCDDKRNARTVFAQNDMTRVLGDPATALSADMIGSTRTFSFNLLGIDYDETFFFDNGIDINSFHVSPVAFTGTDYGYLSDNIRLNSGPFGDRPQTLWVHNRNRPIPFGPFYGPRDGGPHTATYPTISSRYNLTICNNMDLNIEDGARLELGAGGSEPTFATVTVNSDAVLSIGDDPSVSTQRCSLIIHNDSKLIIAQGGRLVIHPNVDIILDGDNAELIIQGGALQLEPGTTFTFIGGNDGSGFVTFSDPLIDGRRSVAGIGAKMLFNGSDKNDLVLKVTSGTLYDDGGQVEKFTLTNAKAELTSSTSRINLVECEIVIDNCHIENSGEGLYFYGQSDGGTIPQSIININNLDINCINSAPNGIVANMVDPNSIGVYLFDVNITGAPTGIYSYGKYLRIIGTGSSDGNGGNRYSTIIVNSSDQPGWSAYMMDFDCEFYRSKVSGYDPGIAFLGTGTIAPILLVHNSRLETNINGVNLIDADIHFKCSQIVDNNNAGLYCSNSFVQLSNSYTDLSNNRYAILSSNSELDLSTGNNNFLSTATPYITGSINNTVQDITDNYFGGTSTNSACSLETISQQPVTITGTPLSSWTQDCSQIQQTGYNGPNLVKIARSNFPEKHVTKANDPYLLYAYNSGLNKLEKNEFLNAFDELNDLLDVNAMQDTANRKLLYSSYRAMMRSINKGIENNEIKLFPDTIGNAYYVLKNTFKIQDKILKNITQDKNIQYKIKLDKANLYRLSYNYSKSLTIINNLLNDSNYIDSWPDLKLRKCFTEAEELVINKKISKDDFLKLIKSCSNIADSSKTLLKQTSQKVEFINKINKNELILSPNPAQDKLTVEITNSNDGLGSIQITDMTGNNQMQLNNVRIGSNNKFNLDIFNLKSGVYTIIVKVNEKVFRDKFVVIH